MPCCSFAFFVKSTMTCMGRIQVPSEVTKDHVLTRLPPLHQPYLEPHSPLR
jgi:hypothetical protein